MESYIEYHFKIVPFSEETADILMAAISEYPFESFTQTEDGILAYVHSNIVNEVTFETSFIHDLEQFTVTYSTQTIEQQNWNETWEKNFSPILVNDQCYVRATFHDPIPSIPFEIVIDPKMSFGTGHHETTFQMIEQILTLDCTNKTILDMGCGTAILAMLAKMKGGKLVEAIDIDEWAYTNAVENADRNKVELIIQQGDASLLKDKKYDIILANINRNILLNDGEIYCNTLEKGGILLTSGYYENDLTIIKNHFKELGMKYLTHSVKNRWVATQFIKE